MTHWLAFLPALGGVKIKICTSNVVLRGKSQFMGHAIDGLRLPFQLEKRADWRFIQFDMNILRPECRSVFFITKFRPQPQAAKRKRPAAINPGAFCAPRPLRGAKHHFSLQIVLIKPSPSRFGTRRARGFGR